MKKLREIFSEFGSKSEFQETHLCCGGGGHSHNEDSHSKVKNVYQCPMKCEGDKTYDVPGTCPVCNMHLAPIK